MCGCECRHSGSGCWWAILDWWCVTFVHVLMRCVMKGSVASFPGSSSAFCCKLYDKKLGRSRGRKWIFSLVMHVTFQCLPWRYCTKLLVCHNKQLCWTRTEAMRETPNEAYVWRGLCHVPHFTNVSGSETPPDLSIESYPLVDYSHKRMRGQ